MKARRPFTMVLLVMAALASLLTACGGESGAAADRGTERVTDQLGDLIEGNFTPPPAEAPEPVAAKDIWIISAWQQVSALAYQAERVTEAADLLGGGRRRATGRTTPTGAGRAVCAKRSPPVLTVS